MLMIYKNLIELYNIIILACVYLFFGILYSITINHFSKFIFKKTSNPILTVFNICLLMLSTVIYAFIINDVMHNMPLPLIGNVNERANIINVQKGTIIFALSLFLFQTELRLQVIDLSSRYF